MTAIQIDNNKGKTRLKRVAFFVREFLAIEVWLSIFIKVFVYDIDLLFVNKVPWLKRLYPYKFFLLIRIRRGCVGYAGHQKGSEDYWLYSSLPNWALLLIFAPAIESVIVTFKRRFILGSFAMLFALALSLTQNRLVVFSCMAFLLVYLLIDYILRLRVAFRPTSVFANIAPTIGDMWRHSIKAFKQNEFQARGGPTA